MRGVSGVSAALIVITIVIMGGAAYAYAATQVSGPQPPAPPVLSGSVTYAVVSPPSAAESTADAIPPGSVQVVIPDSGAETDGIAQFIPPSIRVVLGVNATVTWVNQDSIPHQVLTTYGFSSGDIAPWHAYTYTFTRAGVFMYFCPYFPLMSGVVVVDNP